MAILTLLSIAFIVGVAVTICFFYVIDFFKLEVVQNFLKFLLWIIVVLGAGILWSITILLAMCLDGIKWIFKPKTKLVERTK
jgi:hypothetical protein